METEENINVKTAEKDKTSAHEKEKPSTTHEKTPAVQEKSTVIQEKTASNTKILTTTSAKTKDSNVISLKRSAPEDQDIEQMKTKPSKILKK